MTSQYPVEIPMACLVCWFGLFINDSYVLVRVIAACYGSFRILTPGLLCRGNAVTPLCLYILLRRPIIRYPRKVHPNTALQSRLRPGAADTLEERWYECSQILVTELETYICTMVVGTELFLE